MDQSREERINELLDEFSATPLDVLSEHDKRWVCEKMLDRELQSDEEAHNDYKAMMMSSLGCFVITMMTLIPIVFPVLLLPDFMKALEVASRLSTVVLFFIGFHIAPYLGLNRWVTALTLTGISLGISIIATFTGG